MEIIGKMSGWDLRLFALDQVSSIEKQIKTLKSPNRRASAAGRSEPSIELMRHALRIRGAIEAVGALMAEGRGREVVRAAGAESGSDLTLDETGTPARLTSTEEVNAAAPSPAISAGVPELTGSTAVATVSGTYDGSSGSGPLTFKVIVGGTHGVDELQISVVNLKNKEIDRIYIRKHDPIDRAYRLSNGVDFTLGEGAVLKDDSFSLNLGEQPGPVTPTQPQWSGSTPGLIAVSGVYDGSNGAGRFSFQVTSGGTHGVDDLRIKVYAPDSSEIGQIDVRKRDAPDQAYTLSNGITLQFGAGLLLKGTTFSVDALIAAGGAVNPDNPFNGLGQSTPNLEPGQSVRDGSLTINGVEIAVRSDDTINGVLQRIEQSAAGVTAGYDPDTETVQLAQKTNGSAPGIVLAADTSGFLAAMKLSSAVVAPGSDPESARPLADTTRFSSVRSGTISVNGVDFSIDVQTDSLQDLLARITDSAAGVSASADAGFGRISLHSRDADRNLALDSGATGFFPAAAIADGTYAAEIITFPAAAGGGVSTTGFLSEYVKVLTAGEGAPPSATSTGGTPDAKAIGALIRMIGRSVNAMIAETAAPASLSETMAAVRQDTRDAISTWLDSEGRRFKKDFGIKVDFEARDGQVFAFSEHSERLFEAALSTPQGRAAVREGLFGEAASGLFARLHASATRGTSRLGIEVGTTGLFLDAFA